MSARHALKSHDFMPRYPYEIFLHLVSGINFPNHLHPRGTLVRSDIYMRGVVTEYLDLNFLFTEVTLPYYPIQLSPLPSLSHP